MNCRAPLLALVLALAVWLVASPGAFAQPAPADAAASAPGLKLPDASQIKLPVPRSVRAAEALVGMSRQRLALVVGIGQYGSAAQLDSALRDARAVASALRAAGFVVMAREDLGTDALRADLAEFRSRLQPGGTGFVFIAGLGASVGGNNLLFTPGSRLEAPGTEAGWAANALPLQEVVDAVQGTAEHPRYLVVDAASAHPALGTLVAAAFTEPKVPPGAMLMLSATPGARSDLPAVEALPSPPPTDPQRLAASRFGKELVRALTTPRLTGPDLLRATRTAVLDASQGKQAPWIGGVSDDRDEFAEPSLLDVFLPRTPEDAARMAAKEAQQLLADKNGDRPVTDYANPPPKAAPTPVTDDPGNNDDAPTRPRPPRAADTSSLVETAGAVAGTAAALAGAAAEAQVTKAGAAATVATEAAGAAAQAGKLAAGAVADAAAKPALPTKALPLAATPVAVAAMPPATERGALPPRNAGPTPAPALRKNPFGYTEGDSFTYRVLDTWKGTVVGLVVQTIDQVLDNGDLVVNASESQMDAQGRPIRARNADGSRSRFTPYQELWWSNPRRGESRDVEFDEQVERGNGSRRQIEWSGSVSVGRMRRIKLPAGEFDVLPIEGKGWLHERGVTGPAANRRWYRTVWYAPDLGHPVAIDIEELEGGKLARRERVELVGLQSARVRR